jgi:dynein light intermediate chain
LTELKNKKEAIEKRIAEKRAASEAKRTAEVDFLKYQGQHLENFLKSIESK